MNYEYKVMQASTPISEEQLNELAKEGWGLVTIIAWDGKLLFYLSRLV